MDSNVLLEDFNVHVYAQGLKFSTMTEESQHENEAQEAIEDINRNKDASEFSLGDKRNFFEKEIQVQAESIQRVQTDKQHRARQNRKQFISGFQQNKIPSVKDIHYPPKESIHIKKIGFLKGSVNPSSSIDQFRQVTCRNSEVNIKPKHECDESLYKSDFEHLITSPEDKKEEKEQFTQDIASTIPSTPIPRLRRVQSEHFNIVPPLPPKNFAKEIYRLKKSDDASKSENKQPETDYTTATLNINLQEISATQADPVVQESDNAIPVSKKSTIVKPIPLIDCKQNSDSKKNTYATAKSKIEVSVRPPVLLQRNTFQHLPINSPTSTTMPHHATDRSQQSHDPGLLLLEDSSDAYDSYAFLQEDLQQRTVLQKPVSFQQEREGISNDSFEMDDSDDGELSYGDNKKLVEKKIQKRQLTTSTAPAYRPTPTPRSSPFVRVSSYKTSLQSPRKCALYDDAKRKEEILSKTRPGRKNILEMNKHESDVIFSDVDEQINDNGISATKPAKTTKHRTIKPNILIDCKQSSDSNENTNATSKSKIENLSIGKPPLQFQRNAFQPHPIGSPPSPSILLHAIEPSQQRNKSGLLIIDESSDVSDSYEYLHKNLQQATVRQKSVSIQKTQKGIYQDSCETEDSDDEEEQVYSKKHNADIGVEKHRKNNTPFLQELMGRNKNNSGTPLNNTKQSGEKGTHTCGTTATIDDQDPEPQQRGGLMTEYDANIEEDLSNFVNFTMSDKAIQLQELKSDFFKDYLEEELTTIASHKEFTIERKDIENGILIYLRGPASIVEDVVYRLKAIHQEEIDITQVTTLEDDTNIVMKTLDEHCGQEYCKLFGQNNKCTVGFEKKNGYPSSNKMKMPSADPHSLMLGRTEVKLQIGALANNEAECLVNIIGPKKALDEGMLSKSILEVGGNKLDEMFRESVQMNKQGTVFCTPGTGKLKCKQVLHVLLEKSTNDCKQVIRRAVRKVLEHVKSKYETIAFPPLGVGRMYGYPTVQVAEAMLKALEEFLPFTTIKSVHVIVFYNDDTTYDEFLDVFKIFNKRQRAVKDPLQNKKKTTVVKFAAETKTKCDDVVNKFQNDISTIFLYEETITIQDQIDDAVFSIAKSHNINVIKVAGGYSLRGFKDNVRTVIEETTNFIKQKVSVPEYWDSNPGHSLNHMLWEDKACHLVVLDENYIEYNHIQDLVNQTWIKKYVGQGKDAIGLDALNYLELEIVKIERVENFDLYNDYVHARQKCFKQLKRKQLTCFTPVEELPCSTSAPFSLSCTSGKRLHSRNETYQEVNELYLFHGTDIDNVEPICNGGLDCRLAGGRAMFGQGVYGAESSTKADQYADHKLDRSTDDKKMFLMRMTMGRPYLCSDQNPTKYRRPPCTTCFLDSCKEHKEFFDSVIGDNGKLFREFVVYDKSQCYPEYLITYNRI